MIPPAQRRLLLSSLQQFTRDNNLLHGKALHALILKTTSYLSSSLHISNSLTNLYAKCGSISQAHAIFDRIPNKDVVSWNTLINGYALQGSKKSSFVLQLFRNMVGVENSKAKVLPSARILTAVFVAAASLGNRHVGVAGHGYVVRMSYFEDCFVGSSLVNFYCKVGSLGDARKVFDEMPDRNSVTWSSLISGYAKEGDVKECVGLFRAMRGDGNRNDDVSKFVMTSVVSALASLEFVGVGKQLHGLALRSGLVSSVEVGNAFVTMYAKCGSLDDACRMFEMSEDKNAITWSAMVTGFTQSGDAPKALDLFSKMHHSGVGPSEFTFVGVLNACSDAFAIEEGKQTHCYALKSGFGSQTFVVTALVDMYAKCGKTGDASKGFESIHKLDVVSCTSMIAGYVQNGEDKEALALYGRLERQGILPSELTMTSVLKACASLAALEQGRQIHAQSIKYGFCLQVPIASAISTMYSKCGNLEDGELIFRRMPERDSVCWNAMISGFSQNGRGGEALELFEEMQMEGTKPDDITFLNLLSAASHMGFVDKGWTLFNMMSSKFDLSPRVEHYACMVDILGRAGKLNEAKDFIDSAPFDYSRVLWHILLSAARNFGDFGIGIYAGEKLIELQSRDSSAYVLLSSVYAALNKLDEVERVRRLMELRGISKLTGYSWV